MSPEVHPWLYVVTYCGAASSLRPEGGLGAAERYAEPVYSVPFELYWRRFGDAQFTSERLDATH